MGDGLVCTDCERTAAIKQWKVPVANMALQSFLIPQLCQCLPLTCLQLQEDLQALAQSHWQTPWTWGAAQQVALKAEKLPMWLTCIAHSDL